LGWGGVLPKGVHPSCCQRLRMWLQAHGVANDLRVWRDCVYLIESVLVLPHGLCGGFVDEGG
jgi:hypothetical protein